MIGIWEIMHDESYWDSPALFRPERFLNDTRTKITNIERLIPFGIGKRMCVGSSFAQAEIYLFLAGLIQNFKFDDPTPDQLEPTSGFVLGCPDFSLKVTPRF
jgi:cytochrome P450